MVQVVNPTALLQANKAASASNNIRNQNVKFESVVQSASATGGSAVPSASAASTPATVETLSDQAIATSVAAQNEQAASFEANSDNVAALERASQAINNAYSLGNNPAAPSNTGINLNA